MADEIAYACPEKTQRGDKPDRVRVDVQLKMRSRPSSGGIAASKNGGADYPHYDHASDLKHVSVQRSHDDQCSKHESNQKHAY